MPAALPAAPAIVALPQPQVPALPPGIDPDTLTSVSKESIQLPALRPPVETPGPSYNDYEDIKTRLAETQEALRLERDARKAEFEQAERNRAVLAEYDKQRREQELQRILNLESVEGDDVDLEGFRRILKPVVSTLLEQNELVKQELAQYKKLNENERVKLASEYGKKTEESFIQARHAQLGAKIPSYDKIINSQEFLEFLDKPFIPGMSMKNRQIIDEAFFSSNDEVIISKVNEFLTGRPSLESIAQVSGASNVGRLVPDSEAGGKEAQLKELYEKKRSGQISIHDFRKHVASLKTSAKNDLMPLEGNL
jgi:hypothetical protein